METTKILSLTPSTMQLLISLKFIWLAWEAGFMRKLKLSLKYIGMYFKWHFDVIGSVIAAQVMLMRKLFKENADFNTKPMYEMSQEELAKLINGEMEEVNEQLGMEQMFAMHPVEPTDEEN